MAKAKPRRGRKAEHARRKRERTATRVVRLEERVNTLSWAVEAIRDGRRQLDGELLSTFQKLTEEGTARISQLRDENRSLRSRVDELETFIRELAHDTLGADPTRTIEQAQIALRPEHANG